MTPTVETYTGLQGAYDFFNAELFAGSLPNCMITLQRKSRSRGYYHRGKFAGRNTEAGVDELAMNPASFLGRSDEDILSTLVHEMVHVWQAHHGTEPSRAYHDKEWAAKMKSVGLQPSHTGEPGGRETGKNMTHYTIDGGGFARAASRLASTGWALGYEDRPEPVAAAKKRASKTKYTCPECGVNAWGKPDLFLYCGECDVEMMPAASTS